LLPVDECIAEAVGIIGDTQHNLSRNLKMLYRAGLLNHQKKGKGVFYTLKEQRVSHRKALVDSVRFLPKKKRNTQTFYYFEKLHYKPPTRLSPKKYDAAQNQ